MASTTPSHCTTSSTASPARSLRKRSTPSPLSPPLAPDGVLFGATILGQGVPHNWFGSLLMGLYNKKGIFGNTGDSVEGLKEALGLAFEEWEVTVVGVVALFEARRPRVVKD